jgi:hypothetical protein
VAATHADPRAGAMAGARGRRLVQLYRARQHRGTERLSDHARNLWRRAIRRRSQRDGLAWAKMRRIIDRWLPPPSLASDPLRRQASKVGA